MPQKIDTSRMSGRDLFEYYAFHGEDREYRNTVLTAYMELNEQLFPMLEVCEREQKHILLQYDSFLWSAGALDCPFEVIVG